jgi:hypothetical protein
VQEVLGTRQDQVVARTVLVDLAGEVRAEGGDGFTFGVLAGVESADVPAVEYARALSRARRAVKAL